VLGIISRSKLSEGQVNKEEMLRHEKKRDFLFNMPTTLKKSDVRDLNEKCYLKIKSLRVMLEIFNFFFFLSIATVQRPRYEFGGGLE
jgi:hypothetical protein